ncbi:hypothetical protein Tco_0715118, partial [Tanacetum coccineum]
MTTYEAIQNSGNGANNGASGSASGVEHTARECSYKELLNCKPRDFDNAEGAVTHKRVVLVVRVQRKAHPGPLNSLVPKLLIRTLENVVDFWIANMAKLLF